MPDGIIPILGLNIWETIYMTLASTLIAYAIGLPLGIILVITDKDGIQPRPVPNSIINVIVNIFRSIPFLILLIMLIPFTRAIMGKAYGSTATIVPLTIAAAPFIARMVESSIKEVDRGVIEAAQSMGATVKQIIFKVLIPEAKPSLIVGATISVTTVLGYSAMAGICGGGGLGAIAINYGYYRYQANVMIVTVILIVVLVQIFQAVGMHISRKGDKRL
ncbi:MAG: ABC transporter permease [Firmicutes bacterium]|nr:ABC transporter permease [Bacillota bacterium]MBR0104699.1 ABC transporter permease [Bacillota bacterium]MBR2593496.1 ABC transporter permease [Bacillota bacterium]